MKNYFSLDSFGVVPTTKMQSEEDKRAIEILNNSTTFENNRYTTGLLWKKPSITFPESRNGAMRRLECFEKKLLKDENLRQFTSERIEDYINKEYIRKLTQSELADGPKTWYLPIFIVTNTNKQKHRIVWDAAYVSNGVSLNSELLAGPDQLSSLIFVLYNFRMRKYGVTADIKEMFHRIKVKHSDQDAQRFLWRDCNQARPPDEYVMQVCTFRAKCSPSVAQHIKNFNASKFKDANPRACKAIIDYHYVDDYLDSFNTEAEAINVATKVYEIHKNGGFELRNWISNSENILREMQIESTQENMKQIVENNDLVHRVLGMKWDTATDTFMFSADFGKIHETIKSADGCPTKRNVLRTLMSTFDPLGLISPYLVEGKLLMQNIWRSSIGWDDPINIKEFEMWVSWMKALKSLSNLQIPRCYGNNKIINRQLHVFVDSSEAMYGAAIYMRSESIDRVELSLISSKSRVAPLKPQSIPRLELLAAVLGVRLMNNVLQGHDVTLDDIVCWSDSKTVLCWLSMDPKLFKQFVALRVAEILDSTEAQQWRWISTKDNDADYLTKSRNLDDKFQTQWITGPEFLTSEPSCWPQTVEKPKLKDKQEFRVLIHVEEKGELKNVVPKFESFSSWNRLVRTQAYVIRASKIWIAKLRKQCHEKGPLKKHEIELAERLLYKVAQNEAYGNEIEILLNKGKLEKGSMLNQFGGAG